MGALKPVSRLDGAVEGLAGRRGGFVIFDQAGRRRAGAALPRRAKARQRDGGWRSAKAEGGRGVRNDVGSRASHAGSAFIASNDEWHSNLFRGHTLNRGA